MIVGYALLLFAALASWLPRFVHAESCERVLTIAGEFHDSFGDDLANQEFRATQLAKAGRGESVLGLEGFLDANNPFHRDWLYRKIPGYNPRRSLIYSIESEFSFVVVGLFRERSWWATRSSLVRGEDGPGRYAQLVRMLTRSHAGRQILHATPAGFNQLLELFNEPTPEPQKFINALLQTAWRLAGTPPFETEGIPVNARNFLRTPKDLTGHTHHELAVRWRNVAMARRILDLDRHATTLGLPVTIIVGRGHSEGLFHLLDQRTQLPLRFLLQSEPLHPFIPYTDKDIPLEKADFLF